MVNYNKNRETSHQSDSQTLEKLGYVNSLPQRPNGPAPNPKNGTVSDALVGTAEKFNKLREAYRNMHEASQPKH